MQWLSASSRLLVARSWCPINEVALDGPKHDGGCVQVDECNDDKEDCAAKLQCVGEVVRVV
eukprot:612935-Amphidinium_carterae.6